MLDISRPLRGKHLPALRFLLLAVALGWVLALAAPAVAQGPRYADSEILLKLRPGRRFIQAPPGLVRTSSQALDVWLARHGALEAVPLFPPDGADPSLRAALGMDRFYRVRLGRPADIPAKAAELERHPDVEWSEPNYRGAGAATGAPLSVIPNDPYFDRQWGFHNTGFVPGLGATTPGADIRAIDAWSITTGDSAVLVAVLDSGILSAHPDLAGRVWNNPGEIPGNGIDDEGNGFTDDVHGYNFAYGTGDVADDLGHGTAVSGVLGATSNNGIGVTGLDWACRIMSVKVLNESNFGFYTWWAGGLYYAANQGARVINMSLVGIEPSLVLQTAIRYAHARGCFIAAAMGNGGIGQEFYPAAYEPEVVAVGATDPFDRRAFFSSYGEHIDVVAPGQSISVLFPSGTAPGFGNGTSFATPMVAGLAALLLAHDPTLSSDALRDIIRATADDEVGTAAEDTPGFDRYHGFGRINCYRALTLNRVPHAPVVTAPGEVETVEGVGVSIAVTASDPDGDPILRLEPDLTVLPLGHDGAFSVEANHTSGTLTWTPTLDDAGIYLVTFRAFDPLRGAATTTIRVANTNQSPSLVAPGIVPAVVGDGLQFDVTATDPDLDEVALSATGVPAGARFADNVNNTGTFVWSPAPEQAGSHQVVFLATDGHGGSATAATRIDVTLPDLDPTISGPSAVRGREGALLSFDVVAEDPDGEVIESLTADLSHLPAGNGAVFTAVGGHGTFSWTPAFTHSGTYPVSFMVDEAPESGLTTHLMIDDVDRAPTVGAPELVTGVENGALVVPVTASDPDGDPILTLEAAPLPPGATFEVDPANTSGVLRWTPDFGQAGTFVITVSARSAPRAGAVSGALLEGAAEIHLSIANVGRAPTAAAGGPYAGVVGAPIAFDGSGSHDPDGDELQFAWSFGDGMSGAGSAPSHRYAALGSYAVVLEVSDGAMTDLDSTVARIAGALPARAFLADGHRSVSLAAGSATTCFYLEPAQGSFVNSDVDLATLALVSEGTGTVTRIAPLAGTLHEGDRDRNGVPDLSLCFGKADLRRLFGGVRGRASVVAAVEGNLAGGAAIRAELALVVVNAGPGSAGLVAPNPVSGNGRITVKVDREGPVLVRLYDVRGRLVRTLLDRTHADPGYHDVALEREGGRLPSGIYFVRIEGEETAVVRLAVLR